ncbi:hypothetical protein [Entomomonas asaccharolytica]|uniref:Uncharacterized protein n=1 Tax=Entomomonas asaccharolytica TaxID=2785331 RepID=A0A974NFG0_9GAMM|nr:hypothetical protein [Entomomonas asaccharolytica]QQP85693.1 hypothetical protein JHT90_00045 [Entomomonas asaccharolytica]
MTKPTNSARFIPLNYVSQGNSENVLFYDAEASHDAIYECATARLKAVIDLLEELHELKTITSTSASALSIVTSLLLNDVYTLFEELNPSALESIRK